MAVWEPELDLVRELGQAAQNHFGTQIVAVAAPH